MTDEQQPGEALNVDRMVRLLRQMAHDMRGPLGALTGTADMLLSGIYGELSAKQERAATRIQRNSYRALALLDDMMLYLKAEAGQLDLAPETFNPKQLLQDLRDEISPEAHARELTVQISGIDTLPDVLTGPVMWLRQIMLALAWNAVLFSTPGDITFQTGWQPDTATWTVSVRDHGPGIKPADTAHIFDPLWRGEDRFQGPLATSGFGMGLAVARSLARLVGGTLSLAETGESGSVFTFRVPCPANSEKSA
ncbi:MAG: HAMP domain-containing histidine kinase [Anaerolineae bacterium]|nr:HAMP domain-containing histidine kinase [Anaerolineae bacterium]